MATRDSEEGYQQYGANQPVGAPAPPDYANVNAYQNVDQGNVTNGEELGLVGLEPGPERGFVNWEGVHRRLSIDDESETSSVDENYDALSITSSIEDQLT